MKVAIVGAGPAGLYLGILLKKADPSRAIAILERNPPDATFGWGVVFSEETLGALGDADNRTYVEITDTFARWDGIDIHYRDRLLRSRGHAFSAISRKLLLAILQRRCHELGVELRFGVEIDDIDRLVGEADLVVGADGVNSVVRRTREAAFGVSIRPQGCNYAWFGTDLVLDAFTFVFKPTEHGLIQVHAYPFDERTSTWIVECPERTWRRTGFDTMTEDESRAFCTELFARELRGHRLLGNRSIWMNFLRVRSESWHDGNVVLLGDAAHTAHFTIGSGTKLAMEDAISLANALERHRDVGAALVDYELERQPVVERFQQAADESAAYFERVERQTHMEPLQFAFNLLTRSGRISHANLMQRDPELVRVLDAWFASAATGGHAHPTALAAPPMFAPFETGGTTLANRVVRAPGGPERLVAAAAAGAGLVLTDLVAVSPEGRTTPECPMLRDDGDAAAWVPVVDGVHRAGSRIALELGHAGARGATRPRSEGVDLPLRAGGWPLVAASAIPYGPLATTPKAADETDRARVRDAFVTAAGFAGAVGIDVLELNFAHGYLVAGFLSPLTNRRSDAYGGSLEDRLRWPLEVVDAVRAAWSGPLVVRLSIADRAPRGVTVDEGIAIARRMVERGADLIHVVAGQTVIDDRPEYGRGFLTAHSARVRNEARVPTLVGGYLTTLDEVNTIVGAGRADLCILELPTPTLEVDAEAQAHAGPSDASARAGPPLPRGSGV